MNPIPRLIVISLLLSSPFVRADITPSQEKKAQQINMDLKQDIIDQPGDSKKVTRLRGKLRDAYEGYTQAVQDNGNGTPPSRKAARQVMTVQKELQKQIDKEAGTSALPTGTPEPVSAVSTSSNEEKKEAVTSAVPEPVEPESGDEKLYNDIVNQFGADSPQAEAARRQLN